MGERIRAHDWAATPLGTPEAWPQALRAVVDVMLASNQPMFAAWGSERTLLYNDACAALLGERHPGALGRPLFAAWPAIEPGLRPIIEKALRGEPSRMDETRLVLRDHGDTEEVLLSLSCSPVRGRQGSDVEGVLCVCEDITAQVSTERALRENRQRLETAWEAVRESEARFREMADGLPLVVWVHDAEGHQEMVNETFCEFFGVTRQEMKGGRWQMLMHPEDADAYRARFFECVRDRRPFHAEVRVKRADGQWRWLESWGRPRVTPTGEFRGFVGTSADITRRKEAEAALRESEERFRTLADNIAQLAWMADGSGSVFWYNKRWFDYTGTSLEEMQGWGWKKVHHPDHVDRVVDKVRRFFEAGTVWEDTFPLRGRDGGYRWFLSRAVPIRDESGRVIRWFGTNTDITERREAEERLRESDRRKDEFLAMLGHELRNPLGAIRSATELMRLTKTEDPRLQRAYGVLERQSTHMARLIDGLLEVSRIARGKIDLDTRSLDLREVLEGVLHDRSLRISKRGLELTTEFPLEPVLVRGDPIRLAQVFDNILGNAIKFTDPPGTISVSLQKTDGFAVVRIRDTGVGIGSEMISRIFEPFQQEAKDIARASGGLGIGLALAKGLVELHHGTIEARSAGAGRGAELELRLPLTNAPSEDDEAARTAEVPRSRVLVVEDHADAAAMLRELLETRGHRVSVVDNGPDALEALHTQGADVVLCDLGLPEMSGYEVAHAVRGDASLRDVALVALTGYGQPEDHKRTKEAGFDEHLTKPVDLQALDEVLTRLGRRTA